MVDAPVVNDPLAERRLLASGEIKVVGQIPWSSNYTFVVQLTLDDASCSAIYKPSRGARPLYDFDADTLCQRELAAYLVSQNLGWPRIPTTVLRDGPHGYGSLQQAIDADLDEHYFVLRERAELVPDLKRLAAFDELANNADRKGGHVLLGPAGKVWSVDHGLCFHDEPKLRTVIWEYAGQPFGQAVLADLARLREALGSGLGEGLASLLADAELAALRSRLDHMLTCGKHCLPSHDRRSVPYPLV